MMNKRFLLTSLFIAITVFVLPLFFRTSEVNAAACTCCYTKVTGCSINKAGKCSLVTGSTCASGNTSGTSCVHARTAVTISHKCTSNVCVSLNQTDYHNACSTGVTPPETCTNKCPCTAGSPGGSWIEGGAPTGYIASCLNTTTCSEKKADCSNCSGSRSWYLPNSASTAPPASPSLQYCVIGGACVTLSTNPAAPTLVTIPTPPIGVEIRAVPPTPTVLGRGLTYNYQLDNLADGFNCGTTGTNGNLYDRCQWNLTDPKTYNIQDMVQPYRANGGSYAVRFYAGVLRSCTDEYVYNPTATVGYLKYNTPPVVVSYTSTTSLSGTESDSDNGTAAGTTCSDNNPYEFTIRYRDVDGASTINNMDFWIDDVGPTATQTMNSIHGKLTKSGANWQLKGFGCDASGNNCAFNVNGGIYPGVNAENRHLCSVSTGWKDVLATNVLCTGSTAIGSWTVKSIVEESGTDLVVTYKVWIDTNLGQTIRIYANVEDGVVGTGWINPGTRTLDFTPPTVSIVSPVTVVGSNTVRVDWSVNDGISGVSGIYGRARLVTPGIVNGPITNTTRSVNNYTLSPQDTRPLWSILSPTTGSDTINLLTNEGGVIGFYADSWDVACNYGSSSTTLLNHTEPWAATKGGLLYSAGNINLNTRSIQDNGYYLTRNAALWAEPFRFKIDNPTLVTGTGTEKNDIAHTTELYATGLATSTFSTFNRTQFPNLGFGATSFSDRKNNKPMFDELKSKLNTQLSPDTVKITLNSLTISTMTTPLVSQMAGCGASAKRCVFERVGQLLISPGTGTAPFVCDKPAVFMIDGNLTITSEILKSGSSKNGCMFIVSGDIMLMRGVDLPNNPACNSTNITNSTICYPPYDRVEAYLLADDQIIIRENNETLLNEGLLIHGSIVAFGETNSPAIVWERSLKLASNQRFPSFVIHYDPTYLELARSIFEFKYDTFIQSVGYKPL